MNLFKGQDHLEFADRLKTDENFIEYLVHFKWKDGYKCVKSWIRTSDSWMNEFNINRYLDEFCFKINRSQMKDKVFNNIIGRMEATDKIYQAKLIRS